MAVTLAWLASPVKHAAPAVLVTLKRKCPNPLLAAALGLAIACGSDSTGPSGRPGPFASVSGRGFHTCGLTTADEVYCWGASTGGILGVGETGDQLVPAQVPMPAGLTFTSLSAGTYFTCGLTSNGMAHCWGDNQFGQLGDGTTMNRLVPIAVALPAGVTFSSVSASIPYHAANAFICGLAPAGTAYCWGGNDRGQLGNGSTEARSTPEAVLLPAGVTFASLATGAGHACGLTTTGNVYC